MVWDAGDLLHQTDVKFYRDGCRNTGREDMSNPRFAP